MPEESPTLMKFEPLSESQFCENNCDPNPNSPLPKSGLFRVLKAINEPIMSRKSLIFHKIEKF